MFLHVGAGGTAYQVTESASGTQITMITSTGTTTVNLPGTTYYGLQNFALDGSAYQSTYIGDTYLSGPPSASEPLRPPSRHAVQPLHRHRCRPRQPRSPDLLRATIRPASRHHLTTITPTGRHDAPGTPDYLPDDDRFRRDRVPVDHLERHLLPHRDRPHRHPVNSDAHRRTLRYPRGPQRHRSPDHLRGQLHQRVHLLRHHRHPTGVSSTARCRVPLRTISDHSRRHRISGHRFGWHLLHQRHHAHRCHIDGAHRAPVGNIDIAAERNRVPGLLRRRPTAGYVTHITAIGSTGTVVTDFIGMPTHGVRSHPTGTVYHVSYVGDTHYLSTITSAGSSTTTLPGITSGALMFAADGTAYQITRSGTLNPRTPSPASRPTAPPRPRSRRRAEDLSSRPTEPPCQTTAPFFLTSASTSPSAPPVPQSHGCPKARIGGIVIGPDSVGYQTTRLGSTTPSPRSDRPAPPQTMFPATGWATSRSHRRNAYQASVDGQSTRSPSDLPATRPPRFPAPASRIQIAPDGTVGQTSRDHRSGHRSSHHPCHRHHLRRPKQPFIRRACPSGVRITSDGAVLQTVMTDGYNTRIVVIKPTNPPTGV